MDFKDGLDYLLKKYESVLVEAGPTLCGPYLEDPKIPSPFDYIVLSVFSGKVWEYFSFKNNYGIIDWERMGWSSISKCKEIAGINFIDKMYGDNYF